MRKGHRRVLSSVLALLTAVCSAVLLVPSNPSPLGSRSMPRPASHALSMSKALALTPGPGGGSEYATNWSGYADTGGPFTDVSGSWIQPAVGCAKAKLGFAAFWVGIDGFTSQTVEQTGTEVVCIGQQTTYDAFYELYPAAAVVLDSSTYPVLPEDASPPRSQRGRDPSLPSHCRAAGVGTSPPPGAPLRPWDRRLNGLPKLRRCACSLSASSSRWRTSATLTSPARQPRRPARPALSRPTHSRAS